VRDVYDGMIVSVKEDHCSLMGQIALRFLAPLWVYGRAMVLSIVTRYISSCSCGYSLEGNNTDLEQKSRYSRREGYSMSPCPLVHGYG